MLPTTHPDLKIGVSITLEILGVKTTLGTLWAEPELLPRQEVINDCLVENGMPLSFY